MWKNRLNSKVLSYLLYFTFDGLLTIVSNLKLHRFISEISLLFPKKTLRLFIVVIRVKSWKMEFPSRQVIVQMPRRHFRYRGILEPMLLRAQVI